MHIKRLKSTDPHKLIKQYLFGLDGELEHILSVLLPDQNIFSLNETELSWTKTTIIRLKNMMKDYREKYDTLTQVKETMGMNESMIEILEEFILMQSRCQRYIHLLELLGKEYANEMREIICGLKLMMQWIALKIRFPGITTLEGPDLTADDFKRFWGFIRSDFSAWRRLVDISFRGLSSYQIKIKIALQSIDGASDLIDDLNAFLIELNDKYLAKW